MTKGFTTLTEFAKEIERIESTKQDYIVAKDGMHMDDDDQTLSLRDHEWHEINDFAHGQIASKLGIPKRYYDQMAEIKGLRSHNVNAWLKKNDDGYFVRIKDDKVRAVLSPRYRVIDNYPILAESIFPVLNDHKDDLQVKSFSVTDQKMYLQIVFPSISANVRGDMMNYGITITNSEVGAGAFDLKSFLWRQVCSNGLIAESLIRKYHVGKQMDTSDDGRIFQADTLMKELEAYKLKIRDIVRHSLDDSTRFREMCMKVEGAMFDQIETNLTEAVKNVTKRYSGIILESENEKIVKTIILESENNRWGMVNGITALAHSIENPDRQYQIEKVGFDLLNITKKDWSKIAC